MDKKLRHAVSALVLIILGILAVGSSDDGEKKGPDEIGAFVMSQEFVKGQLKAPSTAEFPWYEESFVEDLGEGRFRVTAYVDAQNTFGAMIRSQYTCVLTSADGEKWILESIDIQ